MDKKRKSNDFNNSNSKYKKVTDFFTKKFETESTDNVFNNTQNASFIEIEQNKNTTLKPHQYKYQKLTQFIKSPSDSLKDDVSTQIINECTDVNDVESVQTDKVKKVNIIDSSADSLPKICEKISEPCDIKEVETEIDSIGIVALNEKTVLSNTLPKNDELRVMNNDESMHCQSFTGEEICSAHTLDIGQYMTADKPNNIILSKLLQHPWIPPRNYTFPHSSHMKKGKEEKRYASHKYLDQFNWLVFSHLKKGYYCKYCPFFSNNEGCGLGKNIPRKLVTEPLTSFAKLLGKEGDLITHEKHQYHINAVCAAKEFLKTLNNPATNIVNLVNNERLRQVKENREKLKSILESIIFLGRQNIPFRGHRDDGPLKINDDISNEGNFRALLKFKVQSGDNVLGAHLESSSSRATYISKTTQNELINCCGDEILDIIISRVQKAKFYSLQFDETTDYSHISQLSIVLRYVYENAVREDFIKFIDLHEKINDMINKDNDDAMEIKVTGVHLGHVIIESAKELNLDLEDFISLGADGCSVNVSETCGAVTTVKDEAKNAIYSPCWNHNLNLSISKSSSVQAIRNTIGIMKETIAFFKASAKRSKKLISIMEHQLISLCELRWVERHKAVMQFRLLLAKIIQALKYISSWNDIQTSTKAKILIKSICDSEFLVSVICLSDILSITLHLSIFLQTVQIDLKSAHELVRNTLSVLERKRQKCDTTFSSIYEEVNGIANELDVEITVPRVVGRQVNRANYSTQDPESYYRQSIYIPVLDHVLQDLKIRFSEDNMIIFTFSILFPGDTTYEDSYLYNKAIKNLAEKYQRFLHLSVIQIQFLLKSELEMWREKWKNETFDFSCGAIGLLKHCHSEIYPIINTLIKIFITMPVNNATPERTFSTLKRVKSLHRATMNEERLNGLCLLNIHRDVPVNVDNVINRYANMRRHRDEFII